MPRGEVSEPAATDMRLLTYNIHKGVGGTDRRYRIERVLDVVEQENPDLVCLQEVTRHAVRTARHDQPALFAARLASAAWLFQLNVHYVHGGYGNLLLSRWPLRSHHHVSLRFHDRKPRGAQLAVVESPEGPLQVVNWHLGLVEWMRAWQTSRLLRHHLFREADGLPCLIAGDTNDWRNRLEALLAANGFRHATSPPSRFRTFPAYLPLGSLDKCFVRGVEVHRVHVVRTPLARRASDHLPLLVDFHLPKPTTSASGESFGDRP